MTTRKLNLNNAGNVNGVIATLKPDDGGLERARVVAFLTAVEASVETESGATLIGRQAASCLLAPAIGDRVLIHSQHSETFILAVLERDANRTAELTVPGAVDMALSTEATLHIKAKSVQVAASSIGLIAEALVQAGERLTSTFRRITESATDKVFSATSLTATLQNRTTRVKDVDVLEARTQVQTIETVSTHTSEIALITAQRDIRLDGERVSVG